MPHVARYLNVPGGDASTATVLTAEPTEIDWLFGGRQGVITVHPNQKSATEFRIVAAHLLLFTLDIGFLAIDVRPVHAERTRDWFDLLHFGRFFNGGRSRSIRIVRPHSANAEVASALLAQQFPDLVVNRPPADPDVTLQTLELKNLSPVLAALLDTVALPGENFDLAHARGRELSNPYFRQLNSPGEMLSYALFFVERDGGQDATSDDRALIERMVGQHHTGRTIDAGTRLAQTDPRLTYREDQWLYVSYESAGFLGVTHGDTEFDRVGLASHLRSEYFIAYCIAGFQRFALLRVSEEVAERALDPSRPFAATQQRVLELTGRCLFVQISHGQHHHAWYSHVREMQEVAALYDEVRGEVSAFMDYRQARAQARDQRRSRATEVLVAVITGIVIPMQFIAALFPEQVKNWPYLRAIPVSAQAYGALALVIALVGITYWVLRRAGRET